MVFPYLRQISVEPVGHSRREERKSEVSIETSRSFDLPRWGVPTYVSEDLDPSGGGVFTTRQERDFDALSSVYVFRSKTPTQNDTKLKGSLTFSWIDIVVPLFTGLTGTEKDLPEVLAFWIGHRSSGLVAVLKITWVKGMYRP